MRPGPPSAPATFLRRVWKILDGHEAGVRWSDNIGPTYQADVIENNLPLDLQTRETARPLAVRLLDCFEPDNDLQSDRHLSGGCIEWIWLGDGVVRITKIDCLNTATATYRCTFGVRRG